MRKIKRTWELPEALYEQVAVLAEVHHRSIVQEVIWLLEQALEAERVQVSPREERGGGHG
jgi:plasmid stability protein